MLAQPTIGRAFLYTSLALTAGSMLHGPWHSYHFGNGIAPCTEISNEVFLVSIRNVSLSCGDIRPFSLSGGLPVWNAPKPDMIRYAAAPDDALYTVIMFDEKRAFLHWMVVNIPGAELKAGVSPSAWHGDERAVYAGPTPLLSEITNGQFWPYRMYAYILYDQGYVYLDDVPFIGDSRYTYDFIGDSRYTYDLPWFAATHDLKMLAVQKYRHRFSNSGLSLAF